MLHNPIDTHEAPTRPLARLAEATTAYLECVRLSVPYAEALGDRGGLVVDMLNSALLETEPGTPASIAFALADLEPGS
jgi:hypothetical protein